MHVIHRHGWCQLVVYFSYVFGFLSVWTVVCFTAERVIVVYRPLQRQQTFTQRRAIVVVAVLSAVALTFYSLFLWTTGVETVGGEGGGGDDDGAIQLCTPSEGYIRLQLIFSYIDSVLTLVLPSVGIVSCNGCIIYKIYKYVRENQQLPDDPSSSGSAIHDGGDGGCFEETLDRGGGDASPALNWQLFAMTSSTVRTSSSKQTVVKTLCRDDDFEKRRNHEAVDFTSCRAELSGGGGVGGGTGCLRSPPNVVYGTSSRICRAASDKTKTTEMASRSSGVHVKVMFRGGGGGGVERPIYPMRIASNSSAQMMRMRKRLRMRTTRTLLVVSSVFLLLNLPSHAFRIYSIVEEIRGGGDRGDDGGDVIDAEASASETSVDYWQQLLLLLYYAHFSVNFFLYIASSQSFRNALRRVFSCCSLAAGLRCCYNCCCDCGFATGGKYHFPAAEAATAATTSYSFGDRMHVYCRTALLRIHRRLPYHRQAHA